MRRVREQIFREENSMTNIAAKKTIGCLTALAALSVPFVPSTHALSTQKNIVLSDTRNYRHCHNV
jgi:hypothetical protein